MKKTLIALAVLAASGAAMAQSSVTMYGVVDLGIGKYDGQKASMTSSEKLSNGTSRLGLRGIEDLGGGMHAGFNFESAINPENGTSDSGWTRQANLWLGGNWGTFKMGRALTPSFYGVNSYELTGATNYNIINNTFGYTGINSRNNSQFSYKTPNMGGFSAEVAYVLKADNSGNAKYDVNAIYKNGPLAAAVTANKVQGQKTNYSLGGKYSFGNFTLGTSYHSAANYTRDTGYSPDGKANRRTGVQLGGKAVFGATSVTLDVTRDLKLKKYTNALLEGRYALSKRTFVYGAFLRLDSTNNYGFGVRHNF